MEIWLLKMVYLLSASWALESILCLTIEKWSKLLRGAHPRESNFCLTIEFGLTIKICVSAAMSSLLHNGYVPKNVQWTWQFTTRPIRHPSFFLARTTWKGKNEKKHAIIHENKLLFLRVPPILTGSCRWCLVGWLLAPTRWFSALLCLIFLRMIFAVVFTFFSLLKFLKGMLNFIHALLVREMRSLGRLKSVALVGQQTSHFRNARWTGDGKFGHQQRL